MDRHRAAVLTTHRFFPTLPESRSRPYFLLSSIASKLARSMFDDTPIVPKVVESHLDLIQTPTRASVLLSVSRSMTLKSSRVIFETCGNLPIRALSSAFLTASTSPFLDSAVLAESVLLLGRVPLVPYAAPSTLALAETAGEAMVEAQAVLLANHGAVTVGTTLGQALSRMETLEHLARVTLFARALGQPRPLAPDEVERLLALGSTPYR